MISAVGTVALAAAAAPVPPGSSRPQVAPGCCSTSVPRLPAAAFCDAVIWTEPGSSTPIVENIVVHPPSVQSLEEGMILMFHGSYEDQCWAKNDLNQGQIVAQKRNELFAAAAAQGWWTVTFNGCTSDECAPGQHNATYGSPEMDRNAVKVIEHMVTNYGIDKTKIYGFGYSMGGDVLNFAARHLDADADGGMLAGVWARSAVTSAAMKYECYPAGHAATFAENILEAAPGEDPDDDPYPFVRASSIHHFDASHGHFDCPGVHQPLPTADPDQSLAHNLAGRHVTLSGAAGDPDDIKNQYLIFDNFMGAMGYDTLVDPNGQQYYQTIFNMQGGHLTWGGFDATAVVNFLARQPTVEYPAPPQTTIALADGRWYWFTIKQDAVGEITPFSWDTELANNRVSITETSNISSIAFNLADLGLQGPQSGSAPRPVLVDYQTLDTASPAADIIISDYGASPPTNVILSIGSLSQMLAQGAGWDHYPATGKLVLHDGGRAMALHQWRIDP